MKQIALLAFFILLAAGSFSQKTSDKDAWMFQPAIKLDDYNPILESDGKAVFFCPVRKQNLKWEEKDVFNPAAVVKDGWVWMLYRAEDTIGKFAGTSRIGLAKSRDGIQFRKTPIPVLYPDNDSLKIFEWEGGCEDPRVVKRDDSTFIMTYTAYDGTTARLCVASSRDLVMWKKHGLAFGNGKYRNIWSKSGAIVCELVGSDVIARKIKGKYQMYWGDTDIFLATSDDLIHWTPVEDKKGNLVSVLKPRPGFFDSKLVEPGPFALLRKEGILLLYNSANNAASGDKSLPDMTYAVGQALFSDAKPEKLVARADRYLMHPERDYEITGQVNNVCFLEGMVWHKDRWLLYYGTADSKIAVAESKQ
ncbi:MAG TPA: glycoside hydrolase family 130 protein [Saprospiraceae bacterium]|nr:glycoside hydrolase family 130 protein [Saprospiraceae bacterium]